MQLEGHRMGRFTIAALALGAALSVGACKKDGPAGGTSADENLPMAAIKEAKEIFAQRCVTCHGASGKGDGVGAAALNPKPRDLTLPDWQKGVGDAHIEKIILSGGPAVGKSVAMPPNPDLDRKPLVLKALRAHVRGLGK